MKRASLCGLLIAVLLSACDPCRRAQGYIEKAVYLCPEAAQLRTDTVVITVPGDSVALVAAFADPNADSLRAVVTQLCEALEAERDAFEVELKGRPFPPQTAKAVKRVRQVVCYHAPVAIDGETARGRVWVDSTGTPHGQCWCKPQRRTAPVTTQQITAGEVIVKGGISWWIWLIIALLSLLCLGLFLAMGHYRFRYLKLKK